MYISGQRDTGRRRAGDIKIPEQYAGNAFSDVNSVYRSDAEALEKAEEAFRRGYVFEETKPKEINAAAVSEDRQAEGTDDAVPTDRNTADAEAAATVSVHKSVPPAPKRKRDGISGLFDKLTSENIILIALILVLWDSKADDELLLMLIILFLC